MRFVNWQDFAERRGSSKGLAYEGDEMAGSDKVFIPEWGPPQENKAPESGWLIEASELASDGPRYLFVEDWAGFAWTADSLKAIHFARRADAEQIIVMLESVDCKATEHQWG